MKRCSYYRNSRFIVLATLFTFCYTSFDFDKSIQSNSLSVRRSRDSHLNQLLNVVTAEAVSSLNSESRFVIHSGPSGVGQGTIKEKMLEDYPGRFQRFLLYATRSRRGIELAPGDLLYDVVKDYYDSGGSYSKEEVASMIPSSAEQKDRDALLNALFPDWSEILINAPREDAPSFEERVGFKKDDQTGEDYIDENGNKNIVVYREFDGIHYRFIEGTLEERTREIFRLEREEGVVVEPVRDYYQGLDVEAAREALSSGDKIYVLEGDRIWFEHVIENFPNATSIFISPLSEAEVRDGMFEILTKKGADVTKEYLDTIDLAGILSGGIERYIAEEDEVSGLINLPQGLNLAPEQNESFLAVKNAILALVGCQIHNDSSNIDIDWLDASSLIEQKNLEVINSSLGTSLNKGKIVEIAKNIYKKIELNENGLTLAAMKVLINEQFRRISGRSESQGVNFKDDQGKFLNPLDPQNASLYANIYVRSSQSPREFGGSFDYKHTLVNSWGVNRLEGAASELTEIILEHIYQDIAREEIVGFLAKRDQLPSNEVDLLLILGSPDQRVAYEAAELFKRGVASKILISGGGLIGDRTEADVFREILINEGIDPDAILIEDSSKDTDQNMKNSIDVLEESGVSFDSIILLQKPLAQRRSEAIFCNHFSENIEVYSYAPYIPDINYMSIAGQQENIRYAIREISRLQDLGIDIDISILTVLNVLEGFLEN